MLLHGFTQNAHCWGNFGVELSRLGPTFAFDLPGHGDSSEINVDLEGSAQLIAAQLENLDHQDEACVIGYSLGGRTALHLALARPDLVDRLVVIGATGGIDDPNERAERRISDDELADHIQHVGTEAFLNEWLAQPLFAGLHPEDSDLRSRLTNTPEGLSSSLRLCGTGTQRPLWSELRSLEMPVLVLAGANDSKFCRLGERLKDAIGANATFKTISGAGHSAHLEQPQATFLAIASWLNPEWA